MVISLGNFLIRNFAQADALSLSRYADNPKIAINLRDAFPSPYTLVDAENFLARVSSQSTITTFAIATENEAIGSIGLMIGQDVHRFSAELGYWLAEPFWGKGIMSSAVVTVVQYGFESLRLNRIYAEPYHTNPASIRVLQKAGFEYEGRMRANVVKKGKILDQLLYAIIRNI